MRSGTGGWTMGCNCDPGRPAPPICEVSGAGLPYRRFEPLLTAKCCEPLNKIAN